MLSVKQDGIMYHFWVFDMTWSGIKPQSLTPLASQILIMVTQENKKATQNKNYIPGTL